MQLSIDYNCPTRSIQPIAALRLIFSLGRHDLRSMAMVLLTILVSVTGCATRPWSQPLESFVLVSQPIDIHGDSRKGMLEIELTSGERAYNGEFDPIICAKRIEGDFVVKVKFQNGNDYVRTSLNSLTQMGKLAFCDRPWRIVTKDYNGDGKVDFNLGQYGTSNGWLYWLFTISPSGEVSVLTVSDSAYGGAIFLDDDKNSTDHIEIVPGGMNYPAASCEVSEVKNTVYHVPEILPRSRAPRNVLIQIQLLRQCRR